jgi:hypothetical protein
MAHYSRATWQKGLTAMVNQMSPPGMVDELHWLDTTRSQL